MSSDRKTAESTAQAVKRAAARVPAAVDRAGDNTPTKPGTEAEHAASGTNETRPDSAQLPEKNSDAAS